MYVLNSDRLKLEAGSFCPPFKLNQRTTNKPDFWHLFLELQKLYKNVVHYMALGDGTPTMLNICFSTDTNLNISKDLSPEIEYEVETESDWSSDDNEPWDDLNVCIDDNVALFDFLKLLIFHIQIPNGSRTENLELQSNNESTDDDLEYLNFDDDWKNAVEEALI
nr:14967_t:CDS:2 [Entrophospora candida]